MEAIRLFDYDSYELIRNNYKEMIQFGPDTTFKIEMDKVIEGKSGTLFTYLCQKGNSRKSEQHTFGIGDPIYFDRYFSLSVSRKDLLEEEFEHFLKFPELRIQRLSSIIANGKVEFLLRRMSTKGILANVIDKQNLVSCLIVAWGKHQEEFAQCWRSVWDVLKAIVAQYEDENVGVGVLIEELNKSDQDFNPARLVLIWLLLENIDRAEDKNIDNDLTRNYDLLKSRTQPIQNTFKSFLQNYQTHFFYSGSYNQLYVRIFITSFAKYHPESYAGIAKEIVADNKRIFLILNIFMIRDSESKTPFGFDPKYIPTLLPGGLKTEFDKTMRQINLKTLSSEDSKAVEGYLKYLDDRNRVN
jgi:hypothetical protein